MDLSLEVTRNNKIGEVENERNVSSSYEFVPRYVNTTSRDIFEVSYDLRVNRKTGDCDLNRVIDSNAILHCAALNVICKMDFFIFTKMANKSIRN